MIDILLIDPAHDQFDQRFKTDGKTLTFGQRVICVNRLDWNFDQLEVKPFRLGNDFRRNLHVIGFDLNMSKRVSRKRAKSALTITHPRAK